MPQTATCPGCQAHLQIPDNAASRLLSCPRCLAEFANPNIATPVIASVVGTPAHPAACPRCGREMNPHWNICPYCEVRMRDREGRHWDESIDADTSRDRKGTSVGLIVLAVLGAIGLAMFFFGGMSEAVQVSQYSGPEAFLPLIFGIVVLSFLVAISTAIMMVRTKTHPERRGIGRVVVGTLALAGALILIGLVVAVCIIVCMFVACAAGGFRM